MVSRNMTFPPTSIQVSNLPAVDFDDNHPPSAHAHPQTADASRQPGPQASADAVILDPEKLPTWQRAFVLGPNVRFTRTPGASAVQRGTHDVETPNAEGAAVLVQQSATPFAAEAASYVIGRGNPIFPPVGNAAGSPVGDLQRQISEALQPPPERDVLIHSDDIKAAALRAMMPPRTGAPLRVPPRLAPQRLGPASAHPAVDHEPSTKSSTTAALPRAEPQGAAGRDIVASLAEPQPAAPAGAASLLPKKAATPSRVVAAIPDHLLWEMLSLGASESMEPRAPAQAPANPPATPQSVAPPLPKSVAIPPLVVSPRYPLPARQIIQPAHAIAESAESAPSAVHLYRQIPVHGGSSANPAVASAEVALSPAETPAVAVATVPVTSTRLTAKRAPGPLSFIQTEDYLFPSVDLLQAALPRQMGTMSQEALEQSAGLLESILEDFGVKGEIIDVRPGPVVTLYEFEPAPGVKSSRIINLSDDIARSMSALSARVAVVPGRNVIGIELPNAERETVYLRELIESGSYVGTDHRLPLCLGKTIGGEPVIADLARMPHLLVAGTTGSGKSVAINTMILSLIYHLRPEECRLIMVDPKMLELSAYDGIPHLLTPVVTDAKKAVLALKWAVREMEERYRNMSRLGVRNIDGFNVRVAQARANGEKIMVNVPCGFDRTTGEQLMEEQELQLTPLPFIVVIVDEMADLMMVAGKEIEGAIQRLAQMARAAGIHLIMATQRPSVDVITGTIKANFPTRISFQVTSKIDSRTILGEQGAEHLLGQGDMLHMVGGGRIARVHGPLVSDREVEKIVAHLKTQGQPAYLGSVTEDSEETSGEEDAAVFDDTAMGAEGDGDELYERAIKIVQRDKKCSTSYIQRRLSIGYNRAASLVERMEQDGLVGAPNHVGKREILGQRSVEGKDSEYQMG